LTVSKIRSVRPGAMPAAGELAGLLAEAFLQDRQQLVDLLQPGLAVGG
jgi:hypothetical protein